jgi:hypothetical protein
MGSASILLARIRIIASKMLALLFEWVIRVWGITTEVGTLNKDKRTTEVGTLNKDKRTTEVVTTGASQFGLKGEFTSLAPPDLVGKGAGGLGLFAFWRCSRYYKLWGSILLNAVTFADDPVAAEKTG